MVMVTFRWLVDGFGDGGGVPGESWGDNNGNGAERRAEAGVGPLRPEWLRCYLGWPTLPGRRRWRTGGLRWRDWLSFGPPLPPLLKWPGSATAEHSYLERGAREGGVKPGERGLAGPGQVLGSVVAA